MGFVRQVNILSISDAVLVYLTLTLKRQVDLFMFYVILVSTFALFPLLFSASFQIWYVVREILLCVNVFSFEFVVNTFAIFKNCIGNL